MSDASAQQGLSLISQNNATLSTYSDRDIGFNFSYPSDWTLYTNKTRLYTVASFESPDKVATVDIRIFPQGNFNSIKEYGDSRFKESGDYTLLQYYRNSSTLLSGKPAIKVVYLTTYNPSIFEKAMGYESSTSKAIMVATIVPEKNQYLLRYIFQSR